MHRPVSSNCAGRFCNKHALLFLQLNVEKFNIETVHISRFLNAHAKHGSHTI